MKSFFNIDHYFDSKKFHGTEYVTILRGLAALAVLFTHANGAGIRFLFIEQTSLNRILNEFVNFGKYGVILFFVLSAYTICSSIDKGHFSFLPYFIRRLKRVLPMYYMACLFSFVVNFQTGYLEQFNIKNDFINLFKHLFFLNIFDYRYLNSLIGVEWSIPIEIIFYLIIPFIFFKVKNNIEKILIQVIVAYIIVVGLEKICGKFFTDPLVYHWSVFKYALSFGLGISCYALNKLIPKDIVFTKISLFFLLAALCVFIVSFRPYQEEFVAIWCALFIFVLSRLKSDNLEFILENKFLLILGSISYSFYLIHYIVYSAYSKILENSFLIFILSFLSTYIISMLTYRYIELPFLRTKKG